jgi:hypothetical protein
MYLSIGGTQEKASKSMVSKTTVKQLHRLQALYSAYRLPFPRSNNVEPRLDLAVFVVKLRISLYPHFPEALPLYPQRPELLQLFADMVAVAHHVVDLGDGVGGNVALCYLDQPREPGNDVKVGKRLTASKGKQQVALLKASTYDLIPKRVRANDCLLQSVDDLWKALRPCLLTGFKKSLFPLLSSLSGVNRVEDIVGLLLLLQELDGPRFKRRGSVAVRSVLSVVLTGKVAILQLHLLLCFGNVSLQGFRSVGHEGSRRGVGLLLELVLVPRRQVQEVGIDGRQVNEGSQGVRSGFA